MCLQCKVHFLESFSTESGKFRQCLSPKPGQWWSVVVDDRLIVGGHLQVGHSPSDCYN